METAGSQRITLRDGRRLAFAEYGDPQGRPFLYFHGFPASRLEAALTDGAAARLGIRIIAPDRPGFGRSDLQPGRRLGDWPADVTQLVDVLGLQQFTVLGVSGGGPYALACAVKIPQRLAAVGLVGGLGPAADTADTAGMATLNRIFLFLFRRAPGLGRPLLALFGAGIRRRPARFFDLFTATVPAVDRAALLAPGIRPLFHASLREAFRQGARGTARELFLYARPWDFDPATIAVPVNLWHGALDITVPPRMGESLARRIPGCRRHLLAAEGHFSLPLRRVEEILRTLAAG